MSAIDNLLEQHFKGCELFFDLLLKQSARADYVVARTYCNGTWHQLSGKDFCAHLGRAVDYWLDLFPLEVREHGQSVLLLGRNSYNSFIAMLGAVLAGLDVMCTPVQMSKTDLEWCLKYFKGVAIATDIDELAPQLKGFPVPVLNISSVLWMPQDKHPEPSLLSLYRELKVVRALNAQKEMDVKDNKKPLDIIKPLTILPENSAWRKTKPGRFSFVSFGHDGFQKPEILNADTLVIAAKNFIIHAQIPRQIFWKSIELMVPSNPFAHLSRFCVLLKNGIIGFPNTSTDWETNLRILRPSFLFASSLEMEQIESFLESLSNYSLSERRSKLSEKINKMNVFMASSKAMKMPKNIFETIKSSLRKASRFVAGSTFVHTAVEDIRFIVHGLAPAKESCVKSLEKFGIPVIESYGTTHAAGMLSSNSFSAANFNEIGTPLPHVNFRLGAHSILEYRLTPSVFSHHGKWEETGDVAQMTPFGFIITGRKKHLFVTLGGAVVSPVRLEKLIKADEIIADACVIGDKLPYLSVLIVLTPAALADYRVDPEKTLETVSEVIAQVNENLPRNVTLKKFTILDKPFSETAGEKLTNGEINRMKIQETRSSFIQSLYG